jgi:hypothetical protein
LRFLPDLPSTLHRSLLARCRDCRTVGCTPCSVVFASFYWSRLNCDVHKPAAKTSCSGWSTAMRRPSVKAGGRRKSSVAALRPISALLTWSLLPSGLSRLDRGKVPSLLCPPLTTARCPVPPSLPEPFLSFQVLSRPDWDKVTLQGCSTDAPTGFKIAQYSAVRSRSASPQGTPLPCPADGGAPRRFLVFHSAHRILRQDTPDPAPSPLLRRQNRRGPLCSISRANLHLQTIQPGTSSTTHVSFLDPGLRPSIPSAIRNLIAHPFALQSNLALTAHTENQRSTSNLPFFGPPQSVEFGPCRRRLRPPLPLLSTHISTTCANNPHFHHDHHYPHLFPN